MLPEQVVGLHCPKNNYGLYIVPKNNLNHKNRACHALLDRLQRYTCVTSTVMHLHLLQPSDMYCNVLHLFLVFRLKLSFTHPSSSMMFKTAQHKKPPRIAFLFSNRLWKK